MTNLPLLGDVAAAAEHCSYCPKMCRFACPVAEVTGKESVTPWGIDRVVAALARGEQLSADQQVPLWACTGCRQCAAPCLPGVDLPTNVRAARAVATVRPEGVEHAAGRDTAAGGAVAAGATPGATTTVYAGCRVEEGDALARLLAAAGVPYDVVTGASCCGARDADVGDPATASARYEHLQGQLAGASRVIVADPHCARWLVVDQGDERVQTLTAWLAGVVSTLVFRDEPSPVAWHDPCWLGRGMGEYDAARAVVAAASGADVVEPEHTRERSWCTGGGMGYAEADPAGAAEILRRRVAELRATGAPATVTSCPTAAERLRAGGQEAFDLPAYLVTRLEGV